MTPTIPVLCACGWSSRRAPGNPVQCPKCGAFAAFQWDSQKPLTTPTAWANITKRGRVAARDVLPVTAACTFTGSR